MSGKTFTKEINVILLPLLLLCVAMLPVGITEEMVLQPSAQPWYRELWTLLTYGFVHYSWQHLIPSLVMLVLILLMRTLSSRQVWISYLSGVMAGGVIFYLLSLLDMVEGSLYGASAGVAGVVCAAMAYGARSRQGTLTLVFGIGLVVFIAYLVLVLFRESSIISLVHLAGALAGVGVQFLYRREKAKAPNDEAYSREVLLKVRTSGYSALTDEERRVL
ncbi:MAG: rhomboid family intramembrane serine protease [Porphyromonas sp.]|nr:rhomboid family intramembrane serine protease [Porphyromonas sp.]